MSAWVWKFKQFKFGYILDVFSFCCEVKSTRKNKPRQKQQKLGKRKGKTIDLCGAFVCFVQSYRTTGSLNCIHTDRITTNRYHRRFWFLNLLKEQISTDSSHCLNGILIWMVNKWHVNAFSHEHTDLVLNVYNFLLSYSTGKNGVSQGR